MSSFALNSREYAALVAARKATKNAKEAFRITAILDLHDGMPAAQICAALRIDESTLWRWRARYEAQGGFGLADNHYKSRNHHLSVAQEVELDGELQGRVWRDAKQVAAHIKDRFGAEYSAAGATALLRRLGYSWHEPKPIPEKANGDAQKLVNAQIEAETERVGAERVYYIDAVHPEHGTVAAKGWIKKGTVMPILSNPRRTRVNIHGALSAAGDVIWREDKRIDNTSVVALLDEIVAKQPTGEVVIIADNATYYHHHDVTAWLAARPRVKLIYLPSYSPNLNKIERLWRLMRSRVMVNKYYAAVDDFRNAVRGFLSTPEVVAAEISSLLAAPCQIINAN